MKTFLQYHVHGHFCPQMNVTILPKYYPHMRTFLQYHVHGHFCPQMKRQFYTNIVHMKTFLQYHVHGHFCLQMKVIILYKYCPHEDIFYNIMSMNIFVLK